MTKNILNIIRIIATWGGVSVTSIGVYLNIVASGSVQGNVLAITGIGMTILGNLAAHAISRHEKTERETDKTIIEDLEDRLYCAEEKIQHPLFNEMFNEFKSNYEIEHQDDWK